MRPTPISVAELDDAFIHDPEILQERQVFWPNQEPKPRKHKGNRHESIRNTCGFARPGYCEQWSLGAHGLLPAARAAACRRRSRLQRATGDGTQAASR